MSNQVSVPFVDDVEKFNKVFGKLINLKPTFPNKKDAEFAYNFIIEEANEMKEAYEKGDIIGILDALLDIVYVGLGNVTLSFGLKEKIALGFAEVQASNMSKSCPTEEIAIKTVEIRSKEFNEPCHYEKVGDVFVVYRTRDGKVMKSISYFPPNLKQFFTEEELKNCQLPKTSE